MTREQVLYNNLQKDIGIYPGVEKEKIYAAMDAYAAEFAEWVSTKFVPIIAKGELKYWQKDNYQNKEYFYSTSELIQLFKQSKQ